MPYDAPTEPTPTHIDMLGLGEQFLVWSVRTWARAHGPDRENAHHFLDLLRKTYKIAGLPEGDVALDSLLTSIVSGQKRPFCTHFPNCCGISDDEVLVLGLVADAQRGERHETRTRLAELVAPAALDPVVAAKNTLARLMESRGMFCRQFAYAVRREGAAVEYGGGHGGNDEATESRTIH